MTTREQHLINAQQHAHKAARTANVGYQIMKWTLIGLGIAVLGLGAALCLFLSLI